MIKSMQMIDLKEKSKILRKHIVDMIGFGIAGHIGGSCSSADIVTALYFYKMQHSPENPNNENRDRFLLSKGHAAPVQYAALAEAGYFPKQEMQKLKELGAMLQGHPDMRKTPGIEANTGSLGQGLSIACGMALGLKLDESTSKVYVLLGDGEIAEGQIWEAAMAAAHYKIDNLVAILDNNGLEATGLIKDRLDISNIKGKWEAFGWETITIEGHDMDAICNALDDADKVKGKPTIIIANTIKGKGISFAENNPAFHNGTLTKQQYNQAISDIENSI